MVARTHSEGPANARAARGRSAGVDAARSPQARTAMALAWLRAHASQAAREGMSRFAIPSDHALGVAMKDIQALARQLGHDHDLAAALWETGVYEARLLAAYVDEPARVTAAQMDRWCRDFDNWAVCDTLCFVLFDRTAHAWGKVVQWSRRRDEMQKRAAFALLASLALHGRLADPARYAEGLALIEREAGDERNFVRKAVSWALRAIGRRTPQHQAALELAGRLAASDDATRRWVGKDALRDLAKGPFQRKADRVAASPRRAN